MKRNPVFRTTEPRLMGYALAACLLLPVQSQAATVVLATQPLTTSTSSNVKPNIMFILDDSGSMDSDYLPDWAANASPALSTNAAYNGVYYNPAISYVPPVYFDTAGNLDTTTYLSQTGISTATGADASAKPNWIKVKQDAYGKQSNTTTNLVSTASYYTIIPGEYCTGPDLKTCVTASADTPAYPSPAPLRWCTNAANAAAATPAAGTCQAIRNPTSNPTSFSFARYPLAQTATIKVGGAGTSTTSNIMVGTQIIGGPAASATTTAALATNIRNAINNCAATAVAPCTTSGFSASVSGSTVTINANITGVFTDSLVVTPTGGMTLTNTAFVSTPLGVVNRVPGSNRLVNIVPSTPNYPYPGSTSKAGERTDCAGTVCTYAEEMANYANWWTYYHTRLQAMKTSVSRAFKSLDSGDYRLGFTTISDKGVTNGNTFLGIDYFRTGFKKTWYDKLFAQAPANSTPLRGALSKVGRYFAKRYAGQVDPVQYACQANYAILSTDGYWNTNEEVNNSYRNTDLYGNLIGDMDAAPVARPMNEGSVASSGSLADIAKYYYDTDLRDLATLGNCTGAASPDFVSGNPNVCNSGTNSSGQKIDTYQRMTTFTMGLGADGTLNYQSDYATAKSGDFYNLKKGLLSVNWPDPINNAAEGRIDDLWHAAVNGKGSYFSAKDPNQILMGFQNALSSIKAKLGAGAAAGTSTLNPVAGNNQAFLASYTTFKWMGNLESREIALSDGSVGFTATWCVEDVLKDDCSKGTYDAATGICTTTIATAADCALPGTVNGTSCETPMALDCTGKMLAQVTAIGGNQRAIYSVKNGLLTPFTSANFAANTYFSAGYISGLNQWATFTAAQRTAAAGVNLVNYLRGDKNYEMTAATSANRLYRLREATLGDALESQPAYFAMPTFNYTYPGYDAFKNGPTRASSVYLGTNDGMLHAFNASSDPLQGGKERWAYIPSMVLPNLWKLANTNYSGNHVNYVNGSPIISDICDSPCVDATSWHTILVGGLNRGGRGYYALEITDPATPKLLWEFTPEKAFPNGSPNLGYSYGRPVITKLANDTWVVLVTSGYDNGTLSGDGVTSYPVATQGDGRGHLFVLNAANGTILSDIVTPASVGSPAASPSGLAQISVWNDETDGNKAGFVYGGDLEGNLWRFDVNVPATAPLKLAEFRDQYFNTQPITTTPILGQVTPTGGGAAQKVVFVGTGKYLETIDLNDNGIVTKQSIYAIKDDGTPAGNPRLATGTNKFVQQTMTLNTGSGGRLRDGSTNPVNFGTDRGWFIDLIDSSTGPKPGAERVNIDGQLVVGTLIFASLVPSSSASACSAGGWGWLNYFDYSNGWPIRDKNDPNNTNVSQKSDASIVGLNNYSTNGDPNTGFVTVATPRPQTPDHHIGFNILKSTYTGTRSIWREMIP